ncbi:PAS domain S-box protein, partial [Halopenitus sp. H-Gu1]|uniref:PAS domain S-box protein n=1 Tax=Halopenitus sp. H-Gu1 TaxID=3242697 RepID=UPI00359CD9C6
MDGQDGRNEDPEKDSGSDDRSADLDGQSAVTESEYEMLFKHAPDGIIVHDAEGQILDANETILEILGYTREELLSMEIPEIEVSLDGGRLQEMWHSLDAGSVESVEDEGIHRRKDGTTFPVEVWVSKVESDGADRFIALVRDITERKENERQIERREEKYRTLFEESRDALMLLDREGFFDCNETTLELFGLDSVAEFTNYTSGELSPPTQPDGTDSETAATEHIEQAFEDGAESFDWVHKRVDGTDFHAEVKLSRIEFDGEPVLQALVRDVTERKERQRELEQYETLWQNLPVGVCRVDPTGDGEFIEVNEALIDMAGAESREALLEQSVADLWKEKSEREALIEQAAETGRETVERRFEMLDGRTVWLRVIVMAQEGSPDLDVVAQDVTDRRQRDIHLEKAQEVGNIGWWRKDIPSDEIYWSDRIYDMWDVEGEGGPIDHETFLDLIHPDDEESVEQAWEAAKEGEPYDIEHRIITGDGETRWMREKAEITFDDGQPVSAVGLVQDITEHKEAKQRLEQFEKAIEQTAHAVYITDVDGTIEYVNPAFETITGYSEPEAVGKTPTLLQSGEQDEEFYEELWETIRSGEQWHGEITDEHNHGQQIVLDQTISPLADDDGNVEKFVAVARDITERKQYERELKRYRTYVESANDVITLIDPDGTIEYVSPAVERVFGWEPTELIGEHGFEYVHPDDRESRFADVAELTESPGTETTFEYRFQQSDGSYVWIETTARNLLEDTDIGGILLSSRDITERKEHQNRLSTLHETTRRIIEAETDTEVAEITVKAASDLLEFSLPSVWYPTDDGSELGMVAASEEYQDRLEKAGTPEPAHPRGSWGWDIFEEGETVVRSPLPQDDIAADVPIQSAILLPLGDHGVLACAANGEVEFTDRQISVAEILARNVRVALDQLDQRAALERQKEFTDDLLDAIEDVVYVLDSDGDLRDWNTAFEEVTGHTSDEFESMNAVNFFSEEDAEAAESALEESFETGRIRAELDLLAADGESIPYEFIANAFEDPNGEPVVAGIGRDRSLHAEYEQKIEEQRDNLEVLNQV